MARKVRKSEVESRSGAGSANGRVSTPGAGAVARAVVPYQELIEQIADYAIFCTDPDGRPTTWNIGVERLLGYGEHEFVGRDVMPEIFTADDVARGVPAWELGQATRMGTANDNRWMRRKNGSEFFCTGMTTSLRDDEGRPIGFAKVMQDRTEQHRQSEALRNATTQLAEVNREKDRFLAVLSHELRNPLAPIRNAVDLLRVAPANSEYARRAIEAIDRQSRHLTHLVDDLLDLSRIGEGKIRLRMAPVELNELLREIADDHGTAFERGRIALRVDLAEQPLRVQGDTVRLAQVLGNLLDNARKFTPAGGKVSLESRREGGHAVLTVQDTGIGMDPRALQNTFEPFAQGRQDLIGHVAGLGLGLALIKSLIDMHGGQVRAHSDGQGRGATFTVRLPLDVAARTVPPQAQAEAYTARRGRVLIVEDNADAAETLSAALTVRGHDVETAKNGAEGLERARAFRPTLVLCDVGLPDMDGYEVARRLRQAPETAATRLVALTGYALPDDVVRARDAGFDRHIAKPPDLESLDRMIAGME